MKYIEFVSKLAKKEFLNLPQDERELFETSLSSIQRNQKPFLDFVHLSTVGPGAVELKINGHPAYRCIYVAKYKDVVVVLGAWEKTTNGVDKRLIETAQTRYKVMTKKFGKP